MKTSLRVRRSLGILPALAIVLGVQPTLLAQDLRQETSLKFVPADVSFYDTSLRTGEQFRAFTESNAFEAIRQLPAVQIGLFMAQAQWTNFEAQGEDNKATIEVVTDLLSNEIFVYGDDGFAELLSLANEMNQINQTAQLEALQSGQEPEEVIIAKMIEAVTSRMDDIQVPNMIIGFKVTDAEKTDAQLRKLEALLQILIAQQPEIADRMSREQVGDASYITLKLDGSLIPWDQLDMDDVPANLRDDVENLMGQVKQKTLQISLGVRENYILLSIGENSDYLSKIGQGPLLADRDELKPLAKHADKKITSVSYVSESFMKSANSAPQQFNQAITMAEQLIPFAELDQDLESELIADIKKLGKELQGLIPESGAMAAFAYMTDQGYEGYAYNWSENLTLDASKPLSLLDHVGGDPILFGLGRTKYSPESYDTFREIVKRSFYYAEKIGLKELGEEEREFYNSVRDKLVGYVETLDVTTRDKLIPAFQDGQAGIVIDSKVTSKQWHIELPESENEMPMLEVAFVYAVDDADSLKEAAKSYLTTIQQIIDTLHEAEPTQIPPVKLPPPQNREFPGGTIYYYSLTGLGVDRQVAPNAGLSKDMLVLSLIPKQTVRLINSTPSQLYGPLADSSRKVGMAGYLNFAKLIESVKPWVDFGLEMSGEGDNPQITQPVEVALKVLGCFQGAASATYLEDGAWVTHYEARFKDLED